MLRLSVGGFALVGRDRRLIRTVVRYDSAVAQKIRLIFSAQVVGVKQVISDARNADSIATWIAFFTVARCQWDIPNNWFSDWSRPGTRITILAYERFGCSGEPGDNLLTRHVMIRASPYARLCDPATSTSPRTTAPCTACNTRTPSAWGCGQSGTRRSSPRARMSSTSDCTLGIADTPSTVESLSTGLSGVGIAV